MIEIRRLVARRESRAKRYDGRGKRRVWLGSLRTSDNHAHKSISYFAGKCDWLQRLYPQRLVMQNMGWLDIPLDHRI